MPSIGYATLQIIPSLRGVTDAIDKQIDGKVVKVSVEPQVDQRAADDAGKKTRQTVEKHTREVKVEPKVDPAAAEKAGRDAGTAIDKGAKAGTKATGRSIGAELGNELGTAAGQQIGDWVRSRFPRTVANLTAVRDVLGTEGAKSGAQFAARLSGQIQGQGLKAVATKAGTALSAGIATAVSTNFQPLIGGLDTISARANTVRDNLSGTFIGSAVGVFADGVDKVSGAMQTVSDVTTTVNEAFDAFKAVQQASSAATTLFAGATTTSTVATTTATGAQWRLNAALTANPIGLIVAGVAALVTGLVLFFTKTELGRKIWAGFTEFLGVAWEKVKIAFQVSWTFIKAVFDAMVAKAGEVWTGIRDRFTAVVDFVKGLPRAITNAAKGMWDGLKAGLLAVLNWISDRWNSFADGLSFHIPGTNIDVKMPKLPKFSGGGYTGDKAIDQIAGVVHGGEFVIRKSATDRIRAAAPGLLEKLNGYAGGGLVAGTDQLRKIISERFGISNIGGYRGEDGFGEHSTGRALDVMTTTQGDAVKDFAVANASAIDLKWAIWRQRMWYPDGSSKPMPDRGSPTQNHMDHVHIFSGPGIVNGLRGPLAPKAPDVNAAAPAAGDAAPADAGVTPAAAAGGGASVPSSISGLASFGLTGLGSGVGATSSGSDLSVFGNAAGAAVSGQVQSALGVLGAGDSPGWLQGIGKLVSGISVSGKDGRKIFGGGSVGSMFGGSQHGAEPVAAMSPPVGAPAGAGIAVGGSGSGQRPGPPGATYNIRTATVEDAFLEAQRKEDVQNKSILSRFGS